MIRRALSAAVVLVLLAGCGVGAGGEAGTAELWVTRDRGATLLVETDVRRGPDADAGARGRGGLETRYGGRFIQSVNGVEGSLASSATGSGS